VLSAIRRVLRDPAYLWVAVPDSSTVTDRVYCWLGRGGGHVNRFSDRDELARLIQQHTSLGRGWEWVLHPGTYAAPRNRPLPAPEPACTDGVLLRAYFTDDATFTSHQ
jgi:hypothetical protein